MTDEEKTVLVVDESPDLSVIRRGEPATTRRDRGTTGFLTAMLGLTAGFLADERLPVITEVDRKGLLKLPPLPRPVRTDEERAAKRAHKKCVEAAKRARRQRGRR
jgi:hypothetical protein